LFRTIKGGAAAYKAALSAKRMAKQQPAFHTTGVQVPSNNATQHATSLLVNMNHRPIAASVFVSNAATRLHQRPNHGYSHSHTYVYMTGNC
jgi:hypothetical protein